MKCVRGPLRAVVARSRKELVRQTGFCLATTAYCRVDWWPRAFVHVFNKTAGDLQGAND